MRKRLEKIEIRAFYFPKDLLLQLKPKVLTMAYKAIYMLAYLSLSPTFGFFNNRLPRKKVFKGEL